MDTLAPEKHCRSAHAVREMAIPKESCIATMAMRSYSNKSSRRCANWLTTGRVCWLLLAAIEVGCSGCALKEPISAWQQGVIGYVTRDGHSDPTLLRDTVDLRDRRALRPAQIKFGELNVRGKGSRALIGYYDVQAILVEHKRVGDKWWLVFLVATLERRGTQTSKIVDVRPVAMNVYDGDVHWCVGPSDAETLTQYVASGAGPPVQDALNINNCAMFPRKTDVFQVASRDDSFTIEEVHSQASWVLLVR